MKRRGKRRTTLATLLLTLLLSAGLWSFAAEEVMAQGQWTTLPYLMPINPIHMALMHNGKVLIVAGSGYDDRDLPRRCGVESGIRVGLGSSPVPAHAPLAQWERRRVRSRSPDDDLRHEHEDLVRGGVDQLQRNAPVWFFGAPAPRPCGRIDAACDDLRRLGSGHRHHGDHRPVGPHAPVA